MDVSSVMSRAIAWAGEYGWAVHVASTLCAKKGQRLCLQNEICSGGCPNYGVGAGDQWVATGDGLNSWVAMGQVYSSRMCQAHDKTEGVLPPWGNGANPRPTTFETRFRCCDGAAPAPWFEQRPAPFPWWDARTACANKQMRLCTRDEVCTGGIPVYGTVAGDVWLATATDEDFENTWVSVGRELPDRMCKTHQEVTGRYPLWGTRTGPEPVTGERSAFRCCIGTHTDAQPITPE